MISNSQNDNPKWPRNHKMGTSGNRFLQFFGRPVSVSACLPPCCAILQRPAPSPARPATSCPAPLPARPCSPALLHLQGGLQAQGRACRGQLGRPAGLSVDQTAAILPVGLPPQGWIRFPQMTGVNRANCLYHIHSISYHFLDCISEI